MTNRATQQFNLLGCCCHKPVTNYPIIYSERDNDLIQLDDELTEDAKYWHILFSI
jgi:hypothetical protein